MIFGRVRIFFTNITELTAMFCIQLHFLQIILSPFIFFKKLHNEKAHILQLGNNGTSSESASTHYIPTMCHILCLALRKLRRR